MTATKFPVRLPGLPGPRPFKEFLASRSFRHVSAVTKELYTTITKDDVEHLKLGHPLLFQVLFGEHPIPLRNGACGKRMEACKETLAARRQIEIEAARQRSRREDILND